MGEKSGAEDIREIDILDSTELKSWLASGRDRQITKTHYDLPVSDFQNFLTSRKRVVASVYLENKADSEGDSTLYNYDILGTNGLTQVGLNHFFLFACLGDSLSKLHGVSDSGAKKAVLGKFIR